MKGLVTKYFQWFIGLSALGMVVWALLDTNTRNQFLTGPGLASGALIAAISLGLVVTYRGSGVVNFANSAIAMYVAYVYAVLRRDGDLFLPPLPNPFALIEGVVHKLDSASTLKLPHWPTRISFGPAMQFWPALLISLVFAVLLGLALHFLIFRPLRSAPPLAKVVASIGLFLYLQAVIVRRFSIQPFAVESMPFFSGSKPLKLPLGISMNSDELAIAILVLVLTGVLYAVFQLTRFGLATRAASENEKGAVVLGFSPEFLAGTNWVISTAITGLLGIFAATVLRTVDPSVLPALIIPALTAALVGSFTSFGWTTFAAMVLGMQYGLVKYLEAQHHWFPKSGGSAFPGMERVLPLVVIVLVLFLRGKSLPTRGAISAGRLPFSPTPPRWATRYAGPALALVAVACGLFAFGPTYRLALANSLIGIIICLSIVVITGYVGQISLAQMAFAGISAYLVAKMTTEHNVPFPIPIFIGAIVAMFVGVLVALPALRVRGVNLAIVTLAFAVAVDRAIFGNQTINGGFKGAPVKVPALIAQPRAVQYKILGFIAGDGKQPNPMTAMFCLVVVVLLCYAVANLRRSATGRRLLATRSNERAAAAAGVNVSGMKILAFATSAFIAGIGGAVSAYRFGGVTPDKFNYVQSLTFFAFAYLGGITSVAGSISGGLLVAGGLVFTFASETLGVPSEFTLILGGLGLIIASVRNPEGIAGAARQMGQAVQHKFARQRPSSDTSDDSPATTATEKAGAH